MHGFVNFLRNPMAFLLLHWHLPVHHSISSLLSPLAHLGVQFPHPRAKSLNKTNHIPDTYKRREKQGKLGVYSHYWKVGRCTGILNACYSLGTTRIGQLLTHDPPILSFIYATNIYQRLLTWHYG